MTKTISAVSPRRAPSPAALAAAKDAGRQAKVKVAARALAKAKEAEAERIASVVGCILAGESREEWEAAVRVNGQQRIVTFVLDGRKYSITRYVK